MKFPFAEKILICLLWIIAATVIFVTPVLGQPVLQKKIMVTEPNVRLEQVLKGLEDTYGIRFYYQPEWLSHIFVEAKFNQLSIGQALDSLLIRREMKYFAMDENNIVILKDPTALLDRQLALDVASRERKKVLQIKIGEESKNRNLLPAIIRGSVIDVNTKAPLEGVNISVINTSQGTFTNKFGRFELKLKPGFRVLSVRAINYDELIVDLQVYSNGFVQFELEEAALVLDEVVITNQIKDEITSSKMGFTQIKMGDVKNAPSLLGQADLMKQIQSYTGVTTVGEAAAGYNVRGGSVDQNLVLFDKIPVFNTSHAFGFFSAFNPDGIRDALFLKSGLTAEYGGRVSSVLDIRSKDGDLNKWGFSGGAGLTSANFKLEGPVIKEKTSVMVTSRFTYSDWLVNSINTDYADLRNSELGFSDWSANISHKVNTDTKFTFSGYASNDKFRFRDDTTYSNQTRIASARFDKQFNSKWGSLIHVGVGDYQYALVSTDLQYRLTYGIRYPSVTTEFYYQDGNHQVVGGVNSIFYSFNPGKFQPLYDNGQEAVSLPEQKAWESAIFVNDEISVSNRLAINLGLRVPYFANLGPARVNQYAEGLPRTPFNVIDTLQFSTNRVVNQFARIEPRLSLRYLVQPSFSVKASYNRINQFLNLITNTAAVSPFDIWQPSNIYFRPQQADQFSIGAYKNLGRGVNLSFESYYKSVKNVLDFKNGARLILNESLETEILQGNATAYGIEFSAVKSEGRLSGFANYSFNRSFSHFPIDEFGQSINRGKRFPANFDQPHHANVQAKYNFTRRYAVSGAFTYRTGRPVTVPFSYYEVESHAVANFTQRNQYRMPDYHRFDLSFTMKGSHRRGKLADGMWIFSLYNVYARKNAYSVFYKENERGRLQAYKLSVIGTVIPSLTYSIKI